MWTSRRTCLSNNWTSLLCAMKWVTGLVHQAFPPCSQARMRIGQGEDWTRPFSQSLPLAITAHATFWYFSLKLLVLPTHVSLDGCYFTSTFSCLSCLPQFPLLCCQCPFWRYSIWFFPELLSFSHKLPPSLTLHFFYFFPLKSHLGSQFSWNSYTAPNDHIHQESCSHWEVQ